MGAVVPHLPDNLNIVGKALVVGETIKTIYFLTDIIVFYLFVVFSCKRADERLHDNAAVSKPEWIVLELIGDMVYHLGSEIHLNVVKIERKDAAQSLSLSSFWFIAHIK